MCQSVYSYRYILINIHYLIRTFIFSCYIFDQFPPEDVIKAKVMYNDIASTLCEDERGRLKSCVNNQSVPCLLTFHDPLKASNK